MTTTYIRAYADPPRPLDELQQAAQGAARYGYDVHHIVEQASGRSGEIPPELINSSENTVSIPTLKHWELNGSYERKNREFKDEEGNEISPRDYLKGKGYAERWRVGLVGLRAVGVLK